MALLWQGVLQTVALPTIRSVAFADERAAAALDTALVRTFAAAHGPPAPAPVEGKVSPPTAPAVASVDSPTSSESFPEKERFRSCQLVLCLCTALYIFVYDTHSNDIMWCETICNSQMRI